MNITCEVTTFVRINNQTSIPGVCDLPDKKYQTHCTSEGLKLELSTNDTIWPQFGCLCDESCLKWGQYPYGVSNQVGAGVFLCFIAYFATVLYHKTRLLG